MGKVELGMKVRINPKCFEGKRHAGKEFIIAAEPRDLCGTEVVALKNVDGTLFSAAYDLSMIQVMQAELLPCPFCGSKNLYAERKDLSETVIVCDDCGVFGPGGCPENDDDITTEEAEDLHPGELMARRRWNERKLPFKTMKDDSPDSWRVTAPNFCGTHTTDEEVANFWLEKGLAYPVYKRPDLPKARGVAVDAESPNRTGVLIMFDRELTSEELRNLHSMLG